MRRPATVTETTPTPPTPSPIRWNGASASRPDYSRGPPGRTITDTHLVVRDRLGRTVVFLARDLHDGLLPNARVYALGIDQASAVVVGRTDVARSSTATGGAAPTSARDGAPAPHAGRPLHYTVEVSHIAQNGERFDLLHKTAPKPWYA